MDVNSINSILIDDFNANGTCVVGISLVFIRPDWHGNLISLSSRNPATHACPPAPLHPTVDSRMAEEQVRQLRRVLWQDRPEEPHAVAPRPFQQQKYRSSSGQSSLARLTFAVLVRPCALPSLCSFVLLLLPLCMSRPLVFLFLLLLSSMRCVVAFTFTIASTSRLHPLHEPCPACTCLGVQMDSWCLSCLLFLLDPSCASSPAVSRLCDEWC